METLDELAALSLKESPDREKRLNQIRDLTRLGMEGKLSFSESLGRRIELLQAHINHLEKLVEHIEDKITPSILRNRWFFRANRGRVFVISNGFKEVITPVARLLHIAEENIFANTFIFDRHGVISGADRTNILTGEGGKAAQIRLLGLKGVIYAIGDGYTDYQLKEAGLVSAFFAFTENVERISVIEKADYVVKCFDDFLTLAG